MDLESLRPTKVIAVHLNYRSRADERGRTPAAPSYFLKPPSSLSRDGDPIVRPQGCELLNFEGEVAVVIGSAVRHVAPHDARACIGWVTAANDLGAYDFRWADRGSNVLAKGHDGFTPIGPVLVPAGELDLDRLVVRTRVDGQILQEDSTANLVFGFDQLIADLSRFMTLEVGDVILTGTPANSRPLEPGQVVEVEVEGIGTIRNEVVAADAPLEPYGAMPKASAQVRAAALGLNAPRPATLSDKAQMALRSVSTATLTVQLRKRGVGNTFMADLRPLRPDLRLLGYAHTLRCVALREDMLAAGTSELNAQMATVEALSPEDVLVIEARGERRAGTIGDILAMRALRRGAAGIVTDGGVRDTPAVSALEIPTYAKSAHAAALGLLHFPLESNVPVSCGGVLVMPGDVIVGDGEGVLVVPAALAEEVASDALEQELREQWALERVDAGESVLGVYPITAGREADYQTWRARRQRAQG